MVKAAIAIGEERPHIAVHDANHATFRCFPKPSVHILIEKPGLFRLHLLIVAVRDAQPCRNLLMCQFIDGKLLPVISRNDRKL